MISISHPSNGLWAATSITLFGWVMTIRIRRKDHRQKYRRWMKIELYNYNYSEEAKQESRESNAILGNEAFPNDGQPECYSCGQTIPHDQEETIPERVGETND